MKSKPIFTALLLCLGFEASAEVIWNPMPPEAYSFGEKYPDAQKLLYAFDYGHALTYERLLLQRGKITDPESFEQDLLKDILYILKNPPNVKPDEEDIAPNYVYTYPLVLNEFDWSHYLHQFIYDAMVTHRGEALTQRIRELEAKYHSNKSIAITPVCKTMLFMDGHYFSKELRYTFPSLNLLIWSYHWLQIKFYEDLMKPTEAERDQAVAKTVQGFWKLVSDLPDSAEFDMMPETAKEAPSFSRAYPSIPGTFDNLHMLHDVLGDMLTSPRVLDSKLRSEGIRYGRMAQDPEAFKAARCPEF